MMIVNGYSWVKCSFVVSIVVAFVYAYQKFTLLNFAGNTASFHIIQPSTDNDVQIVSPTSIMTSITCSLNITIPSSTIVVWSHNTSLITDRSQITTAGSTTTLLIDKLELSDAGEYQCSFNDAVGSGWTVTRNIRLFITGMSPANYVCLYVYRYTTSMQSPISHLVKGRCCATILYPPCT